MMAMQSAVYQCPRGTGAEVSLATNSSMFGPAGRPSRPHRLWGTNLMHRVWTPGRREVPHGVPCACMPLQHEHAGVVLQPPSQTGDCHVDDARLARARRVHNGVPHAQSDAWAVAQSAPREPQMDQPPQYQQQQQQPSTGRRLDPADITARITRATCLAQLQQLLHRDRAALNAVHVSLLLQKAVAFASSDPGLWFQQHRPPRPAGAKRASAGRWAATASMHAEPLYASSSSAGDWGMSDEGDVGRGSHGTQQWTQQGAPQPGPSSRLPPAAEAIAMRQLSQLVDRAAWVGAALGAAEPIAAVPASCMVSALAKLGCARRGAVARILAAAQPGLAAAPPAALSNMLWGAAGTRVVPSPAWMSAFEAAVLRVLPECPAQELCTVVRAMGVLRHSPSPAFLVAVCDGAARLLPTARPRDVSNLAAGLAGMQHMPEEGWTASFMAATAPRLRYFPLQALQRTLMALAALRCQPDGAWLDAFYAAAGEALGPTQSGDGAGLSSGRPPLSTGGAAAMLGALGRLGARPPAPWVEQCLSSARASFPSSRPGDMLGLLDALAALRYRPSDGWMAAAMTATFGHLHALPPPHLLRLLARLAQLRHTPPPIWQQELLSKVQGRLGQYTGDETCQLLVRLAVLGMRPGPDWLAAWERATQDRMTALSAPGLAAAVWALAELGHQPAVGWLYGFVLTAYSRLDAFDAAQLTRVFEALPRIAPHPGWLDELVQICASQASPEWRAQHSGSYDELCDDPTAGAADASQDGASSSAGEPQRAPRAPAVAPVEETLTPGQLAGNEGGVLVSVSGGLWSTVGAGGFAAARPASAEPAGTTLRVYGLRRASSSSPLDDMGSRWDSMALGAGLGHGPWAACGGVGTMGAPRPQLLPST